MDQIPELLKPIFAKVEFLERCCKGAIEYNEENLYFLEQPIDFISISTNIELIPYFESIKLLKSLKVRVERIFNDDDWYEILKNRIFKIKDAIDNDTAEEILDLELKQLLNFIDDLIINVQLTIPGDELFGNSLKLESFTSILRWVDQNDHKIISVEGEKSDAEIAFQFYSIYKGLKFSTEYVFNFNWSKEAVCYFLIKLADTNKSINRERFIECKYFKHKNQNFIYGNVRKSNTSFEIKNSPLKIIIDRYFENLTK